MEDQNFSVAPGRDLSRHDATDNNTDFSLSLEQVAERYATAGHPRTLRSLQRYCVSGHLDARKIATTTGDKYLVTPQSVARHIAQIVEFSQLDAVATMRDTSRPVATPIVKEIPLNPASPASAPGATGPDTARPIATANNSPTTDTPLSPPSAQHEASTALDTSRPVATEVAATRETSRYVAQLEHEIEVARDERDFLREQINRKDRTIKSLIERDRETNVLVRGLQEMLTPLLGGRRREDPPTTYGQ